MIYAIVKHFTTEVPRGFWRFGAEPEHFATVRSTVGSDAPAMQKSLIGFHVIGCTYGFWLPNDERGSGSDFVRSEDLAKFGPANPVTHRRSVAQKPYDFKVRQLARTSLMCPPVVFNDAMIARWRGDLTKN